MKNIKYRVLSDLTINEKQYKTGDILESNKQYLLEQIGSLKIIEESKPTSKPTSKITSKITSKPKKQYRKNKETENTVKNTVEETINDTLNDL